ncbi:MAG: DUF72 domain-containing protein [Candidatus Dormibacteraeota bacterium]|uniref:DUF72 domain-containing protein n=1 Tax=Candidatus Aeolococcus gillhamiae TaxID=3127015 RepID=A0A2W6AEF6_9BACT|nr:DUF72 domain-containing protein [Candidatus Dormibacteraeota bacterium]PZR81834.1 MAG: DUF72 domain-containing protein [Candidatus Dormibacter sp. RRmetagenome_bin12]
MAAEIRVGTCNWADHKEFYPPELERGRRQREKLEYYARFFPMVEIDTSFYGLPKPEVVDSWIGRTPAGFRFNIKAFRSLTRHERENGRPRPPTDEEVRDFLAALSPLRDSGRLGAVHYQFPPWFTNRPDARDVLLETRERHPDDIVAVEFRHRSWFDNDAWPATEDLLRELDCVYVGVDAPQLGSGTAPPILAITSPKLCIARFHGRNRTTWYRPDGPTSDYRFNYLYSPRELEEWVPAIREAADRGTPVHVLLNNNRSNYAVVNAFDFAALLDVPLPRPPQPILERIVERDGSVPAWVAEAPPPTEPAAADPSSGQASLDIDG